MKEQMDFLRGKDEDMAKQHQKLLENEERHIQKLEKDIEKLKEDKKKLQSRVKDYFLPEIKKLQMLNAKLEKSHLMYKNQLKECKADLKEKVKTIAQLQEEAQKDESLQNIRFLQQQNSVLQVDLKTMKHSLVKKTSQCKDLEEEISILNGRVTELETALEKKSAWNSQTQLFYTEKKDYIDSLKREKMSLSRQLKKETKKAIKREDVINDLLDRNGKLRQALLTSSIPPATVVDHVVEKAFYDNVSTQLKLIQQQLDMDGTVGDP